MIVCNRRVVLPWVKKRVDAMFPTAGVAAIGQQSGGEMVAGVVYDHYTGASIQATIAVKPKARLSKMFLWAIFDYPFNQLGVKKIIANVKEDNEKSLFMLHRMGFEQEGEITDAFEDGSMVIMTLTRKNCSLLERLNHG